MRSDFLTNQDFDPESTPLDLSLFGHERDNRPKLEHTTLAALLRPHEVRVEKVGTPAFSPARFRAGTKRRKNNVLAVTALAFDFDRQPLGALLTVRDALVGVAHCLYSTWSHGPESDSFRVVLLLSRELVPHEFAPVRDAVIDELREVTGLAPDNNALDISRLHYLPACPAERAEHAVLHVTTGRAPDVDAILAATGLAYGHAALPRTCPAMDGSKITKGRRNNALASVAGLLRRNGKSRAAMAAELQAINVDRCQPPLPRQEVENVARSIARYSSGRTCSPRVGQEIMRIFRVADAWPWKGRSGASDLKVLAAHIRLAIRAGSLEHFASVRTTAVEAGVSAQTIVLAHPRVIAAGFLEQVLEDRPRDKAGLWRLGAPAAQLAHKNHLQAGEGLEWLCVLLAPCDLWRRGFLGPACWRTYLKMGQRPCWDVADLVEAVRWHPRTVERHLRSLCTHGLADRNPDGTWTVGLADPHAMADFLGATTHGVRQRQRFERERQAWHGTTEVNGHEGVEEPVPPELSWLDEKWQRVRGWGLNPVQQAEAMRVYERWNEVDYWYEREERDAIEAGDAVTPLEVEQPWMREQLAALRF